jgi:hypothetical protein
VDELEFRRRLESITTATERTGMTDWFPMFEELRHEYPHTIVETDPGVDRRVNCFAFALGLHDSEVYWRVVALCWELNVFADPRFIHYLLERHDLVERAFPEVGENLVVYFDIAGPKHAGIFESHRVRSKWGTGRCFEHGLWEIPSNYGDHATCFDLPQIAVVEPAFVEFALARGADPVGL